MTEVKKGRILSGMRPTGKLHLGHLSVVESWAAQQNDYECFYFIADWHALTTQFDDTSAIREAGRQMTIDWLAAGLNPEKSPIFRQSDIKTHAELYLLFSMMTPLSWLERVPTYKDQVHQFGEQGKDITTHGFLGYPLLMAVDILIYLADYVPVGEDQLPHLEFAREMVRRFNYLYNCDVLKEPQALLAKIKMLPGVDNRKMSKSYNNYISITAEPEEIKERCIQMITDPARIRKTDLGHPDICTVYAYHGFYNAEEQPDIACRCKAGEIGCFACKARLQQKLNEFIAPIRERRRQLEENPARIDEILAAGAEVAKKESEKTMEAVRGVMKI